MAFSLCVGLCVGAFAQSKETFSTTSATAPFGKEQIVTLNESNKFTLSGKAIRVVDYMPSANLMASELKPFDTSDKTNSVKIYSVLTSVDTPVCFQQGIDLSNYISKHQSKLKGIEFYVISADTPFAQQRYIKDNALSSITFLSDSSKHEFGMNTGSHRRVRTFNVSATKVPILGVASISHGSANINSPELMPSKKHPVR